jgi:cytochrome c oxidase subunit 2
MSGAPRRRSEPGSEALPRPPGGDGPVVRWDEAEAAGAMVRLTRWLAERPERVRALLAGAAAAGAAGSAAGARAAEPHPWQLGFQPPATPVQARLEAFNNELTVIIGLITVFVLGLLLYVIVRYRASRNPVPSHRTHNTVIEILWTIIPVVILVIIAIPSFKLMFFMADVPDPHMTVKVTGHQWYWTYTYPDSGNLAFDSNIVQQADLKPGQLRLLTVDHPLVVPVDTNIKVDVGSTDVIHSWFMPSFGVQEYAMPGRENEAWFRIPKEGVYHGQCNQLCGLNHAFMPIVVKAVSKDEFKRWLVEAKKEFARDRQDEAAPRVAGLASRAPGGAPRLVARLAGN